MKRSLRKKVLLFIIGMALTFSIVSVAVSHRVITNMINDHFTRHATEIASTTGIFLDREEVRLVKEAVMEIYNAIDDEDRYNSEYWGSPEFDAYVSQFEPVTRLPEFAHIQEQMRALQDKNDVACIYLSYLDPVSVASIYLCDAALEDACPPGCFDQYNMESRDNQFALAHPEYGYPALITNTEAYGWLVSVAVPIFDEDRNVICFSCVDISMNQIRGQQLKFTLFMLALLLIMSYVVCLLGFFLVNHNVVEPINLLSRTAANYMKEDNTVIRHAFADLEINRQDEIGALADSMKQMEADINGYHVNLLAAQQEILSTREEVTRMEEFANRDALTGIRNRRAYDETVSDLDAQIRAGEEVAFGIAMVDLNDLKGINDRYGHDKGNIAIRKLCHLICIIFSHSPVFRIGGDEFAVILRDHDLEIVDELIARFENIIAGYAYDHELMPWEKTSAALGYADYRPGEDHATEDVFQRADSLMYARKHTMKKGDVR